MTHGEEAALWRQGAAVILSLLVIRVWMSGLKVKLGSTQAGDEVSA